MPGCVIDNEHSTVGQVDLGGFDRVPEHVFARRFASGFGSATEDGVLSGGQTQVQSFGLRGHAYSVHQLPYIYPGAGSAVGYGPSLFTPTLGHPDGPSIPGGNLAKNRHQKVYSGAVGRTQIYLGDDELELLDRMARTTGASRSELVRRAVRNTFGEKTKAERLQALEASAGAFRGQRLTGADYVDVLRGDLNERLNRQGLG